MFTGIVAGLCEVTTITDREGLRTLTIPLRVDSSGLLIGASVAVNGVCLTVVKIEEGKEEGVKVVSFDCIQETLSRTNLGELEVGAKVNVERAMKIGDEIGGHNVSGHVDCKGKILRIEKTINNQEVFVTFPKEYSKYLVSKGWICIDGVSLTVVQVNEDNFSVCLIPETLQRTTLGFKKEGAHVNLEFDSQAKLTVATIERILPTLIQQYLPKTQ